jgi:hypothetical protein
MLTCSRGATVGCKRNWARHGAADAMLDLHRRAVLPSHDLLPGLRPDLIGREHHPKAVAPSDAGFQTTEEIVSSPVTSREEFRMRPSRNHRWTPQDSRI